MGDKLNPQELVEELSKEAEKFGGTLYPVDISKVVPRQSIRLRCQAPLCRHYGVCKICPPQIPTVDEFKEALKDYSQAFLIVYRHKFSSIENFRRGNAEELKLGELISAVEAKAFALGEYQSFALGIGGCKLCPEGCAPQGQPCRHPRKARPSPEGFGVDITELARAAGVPVEWPPKEYVHLMGMLFI